MGRAVLPRPSGRPGPARGRGRVGRGHRSARRRCGAAWPTSCPSGRSPPRPGWCRATAPSSGACAPPTAPWSRRSSSPTRPGRRTICVSSQAGLRPGVQVLRHRRHGRRARPDARPRSSTRPCSPPPRRRPRARASPTSVFMGMGEPLQNARRRARGLRRDQLPRRARASRPGRSRSPPWAGCRASPALAAHPLPVRLAVSLHAADDRDPQRADADQRPLPHREPARRLPPLLRPAPGAGCSSSTCCSTASTTRAADARRLAGLLRDGRFHVNLIEYNPTDGPYRGSSRDRREVFLHALAERGPRGVRAPLPRRRRRRRLRPAGRGCRPRRASLRGRPPASGSTPPRRASRPGRPGARRPGRRPACR